MEEGSCEAWERDLDATLKLLDGSLSRDEVIQQMAAGTRAAKRKYNCGCALYPH